MNAVRSTWLAGGKAVLGWLQIPATLHAEALARCGYDALVVDLQHSPTDFATALAMLLAIEVGGAEPFVRLQSNCPSDIMKLLDCGARGVIVPMIDTADQARSFASALHYPPHGSRSFGPRRPLLRYGPSYSEFASETIVALAMIETKLALQNLVEILSIDGIDGVFIGPTDLSLALGAGPEADSADPRVIAAVGRVLASAHAHGKRAGIYCASPEFAREKLAEGFDLVSLPPDLSMLVSAAHASLAKVRPAMGN